MKYQIVVIEHILGIYQPAEIEAETEEDAEIIAEERRVQGDLGEPTKTVDGVRYWTNRSKS